MIDMPVPTDRDIRRFWSKVNASRTPANAVICAAVIGGIITLPALKSVGGIPTAFYAVSMRPLEGLAAPDFTLPDMNGVPRSLSQLRGKKVFLATWASW